MNIEITPVSEKTLEDLVVLFGEYQMFYQAKPNRDHNRTFLQNFFKRDDGIFFLCHYGEQKIGYVSLYFSYSSVSAKRIAILNDLYVCEQFRGQGIGKALIDFAINYSREIGISQVRWCTRINNTQAQTLYKKYNANKTDWFHYDLDVS